MNPAQIHLALNHFPLIGMIFGILFLVVGFARRAPAGLIGGLWLVVLAALASVPTFLSGEPAEELIEHRPGVSEAAIHEHEEAAEFAFVLLLVSGAIAGGAITLRHRKPALSRKLTLAALASSLLTAGVTARTAHLGGLIRHDELGPLPAEVKQHEHESHEH